MSRFDPTPHVSAPHSAFACPFHVVLTIYQFALAHVHASSLPHSARRPNSPAFPPPCAPLHISTLTCGLHSPSRFMRLRFTMVDGGVGADGGEYCTALLPHLTRQAVTPAEPWESVQ